MLGRIVMPSVQTNDDGSVLYTWDDGGFVSVDAAGNITAVSNTAPLSQPQRFAQYLRAQSGVTSMTYEDAIDMGTLPAGMSREQYRAIESIAPNASAIIAQNQTPGESWSDTLQKVLTGLVATNQQRQLMQINIDRAKAGLPPVDINAYTGVGVNVGLSAGTQQLVTYALLGVGAFLLLNMYSRR